MSNYSVITLIPYVDKIYCDAVLGERITHQQTSSNYSHIREININHNRHELQDYVKYNVTGVDLVLLMDSDVIATEEQLNALLNAFKGDPIALKTKQFNTGSHICCACCLMKLEDYLKIDYINEFIDECQCLKIMKLFKVSYLEGYQATEFKEKSTFSNVFHGTDVKPYYEDMTTRHEFSKGSVVNGGQ